MSVNGSAPATATGTVEAVNPKGIKIDGVWANYSKFAEGIVEPSRGQLVTVTFDRSGFIRAITPADGSVAASASYSAHHAANDEKQRTITRLAVLKAAAEFAAPRSQMKSADVLLVAASWERWVLRDDDAFAVEDLP